MEGPLAQSIVDTFSEGVWKDLIELCGRLEHLWNAASRAIYDRKEIIRTMVTSVIAEEHIRARADQAPRPERR